MKLNIPCSDRQDPGVLVPGVQVPADYSRNYQSVPQPGLDGRTSPVYSAAVVGGGTVVNGMFFNRGSADYDYVIIGGGTSGLTVANRLTENPESTATSSAPDALLIAY